jgi:hypothetical protein
MNADRQRVARMDRRCFERQVGLTFAGAAIWPWAWAAGSAAPLIASIERRILWKGRQTGRTWFHPRACLVPGDRGVPRVFMTLQEITGSDVYGTVHWTVSTDLGQTWREPEPIAAFVCGKITDVREEGVCDVVPQYQPGTGTILALGHNVYYRDGKLTSVAEGRYPVYAVGTPEGRWSGRRKLAWDDPRGTAIYTSGCGERVLLPDGDVLMPFSFGPSGRTHRSVTSLLCAFDGREVARSAPMAGSFTARTIGAQRAGGENRRCWAEFTVSVTFSLPIAMVSK